MMNRAGAPARSGQGNERAVDIRGAVVDLSCMLSADLHAGCISSGQREVDMYRSRGRRLSSLAQVRVVSVRLAAVAAAAQRLQIVGPVAATL